MDRVKSEKSEEDKDVSKELLERERACGGTVAWYTKLKDLHGNGLLCQDFLFLLVVCPKKMSPANISSTESFSRICLEMHMNSSAASQQNFDISFVLGPMFFGYQ